MSRPTVMLVGLGYLGGVLLELLARQPWLGRIVACSRNRVRGEARCNLARVGALAQGLEPQIEYRQMDLCARERFAEWVRRCAPDLIVSTASMQTWWLPELLPTEAARPLLRAGFGIWLPCHLAPTLRLMEALAAADFGGPVLTAPFPDVVNPILACLERAPTCGVGNVDEIAAKVRLGASRRLAAAVEEIEVLLVAHHALQSAAFGEPVRPIPPYFLRVTRAGRDVTPELEPTELLTSPYPLPGGPADAFLTAGSTVRLAKAVLGAAEHLQHAPAPNGLPGGYPVLAGGGRVRPAPIDGLTLDEAIAINERSHPFDGVERIEADGTAVFVPEMVEISRTELGYDCERLAPQEADERGGELKARFREYASRHGVDLKTVI